MKTEASVLGRTRDGHGAPDRQECNEEMIEEFKKTGEHEEHEEPSVSKQQIRTKLEPEPEQEAHISLGCNEEHGRELVPLDIPDFLLPDAPEDENDGEHAARLANQNLYF